MEQVVSCRLERKEVDFIAEYSLEKSESKGEILRDLLVEGRLMEGMRAYKGGKASLGKSAHIAGISISEMMDLLKEFGVHSNMTPEDFRESLVHLKAIK